MATRRTKTERRKQMREQRRPGYPLRRAVRSVLIAGLNNVIEREILNGVVPGLQGDRRTEEDIRRAFESHTVTGLFGDLRRMLTGAEEP